MKQLFFLSILIFSFLNPGYACLNEEIKELKDGTGIYEDREGNVPYGHRFYSDEVFETALIRLDSLYKTTRQLDYLSDKGLLLILLKRYQEAINLYLEIERIKPNRYSTASNIGTAYELMGQNENALRWIQKAVAINPKSHNHSEWIHVKILEAKIKGEQFYNTSFLLNTDFGPDLLPKSNLDRGQLYKLSNALYYQLNERVSFVKPKEKIVAQLLFDLGNVAFILGNVDDALADYEQAKRYGFSGSLIQDRINEINRLYKLPQKESKKIVAKKVKPNYFLYTSSGLTILAIAIVILIVTRRKENSSQNKN